MPKSSAEAQPVPSAIAGISGIEPQKPDCPGCSSLRGAPELARAALHPALRGSPYAKRLADYKMHVCRLCDRVWSQHHDTREDYTYYRFLGEGALPLLAADSNLPRIVDWVAEKVSSDGRMVEAVARKVLRIRPVDLQPGVDAILRRLAGGVAPPTPLGAERIAGLVRLLEILVERAVAADLRPPGSHNPSWARPTVEELERVVSEFTPHEVDGLAHLGFNPDTIRRLAAESQLRHGAATHEAALLAIEDAGALWTVLDSVPMIGSPGFPNRGYPVKDCWKALTTLRLEGARAGNEHVLYLSSRARCELDEHLDPVHRLATLARRLLDIAEADPEERFAAVEEAVLLVPLLLNQGARFSPAVIVELKGMLENLRANSSEHFDGMSAGRLDAIIHGAERAASFDGAVCFDA